jgi:glycerol-3-phosphate dehydrogenase
MDTIPQTTHPFNAVICGYPQGLRISAAKETFFLAKKYNIDMPITEQIYRVLYDGLAPLSAVQNLLQRDQKAEDL